MIFYFKNMIILLLNLITFLFWRQFCDLCLYINEMDARLYLKETDSLTSELLECAACLTVRLCVPYFAIVGGMANMRLDSDDSSWQ